MEGYYWILWLVLAGIFLAAELMTVAMISLWFVAGSLAAMIAALLGASLGWQIAIMLITSAILLGLFLAFRKKLGILPAQRKPTNADRLIGRQAVVTIAIDPVKNVGQVQADGQIWSARTEGTEPIPVGTLVRIKELRGVKLVVEAI